MGSSARVAFIVVFTACLAVFPPVSQSGKGEGPVFFDTYEYLSSDEIEFVLERIAMDNPRIAEYSTAQELLGTREIPGSRSIPILFLGNRSDRNRPWIMLIGAHHGDEPDSALIPLAFVQHVIEEYRSLDPELSRLVSGLNMAILPVVNPYGLDQGTRVDENGEDPNRDYPFSPEGVTGTSDGIPLTTAGAHAVTELASRYPFSLALSFHTGSEGIFTPWGAEGLSSISPDINMYLDLGKVLSRASGGNFRYGPANEFSGLGYLNGAFDDHLYGSNIYPDRLWDPDLTLPWSIATATIEMGEYKGVNRDYLGSPSGIDDIGGVSDGNIPRGVRMCRAACEMALPSLYGDAKLQENGISFNMTLTGSASRSDPIFRVDDDLPGPALHLTATEHEYLPVTYLKGTVNLSLSQGPHPFMAEIMIDEDWNTNVPFSEPSGSPRSIISLSREGSSGKMTWSTIIEDPENEEWKIPSGVKIVYLPVRNAAGGATRIDLNISADAGNPMSLTIRSTVDWNTESSVIPVGQLIKGVSSYEFITPVMEGEARIEVELITDRGEFRDEGEMLLYPSVSIMNVLTVPGEPDRYRIYVGVDGGSGPTTVFYGLSRDPTTEWSEAGWTIGPLGKVTQGYGPFIIDLDLSHLGGNLYLRVCNFPGSIESVEFFELPAAVGITGPEIKETGEELIIGPSIIHLRGDGMEEVTPAWSSMNYVVEITHIESNRTETGELTWKPIHHMTPEEREDLLEAAVRPGMEEERLTGGWMAYRQLPVKDGNYLLGFHVHGTIMPSSSHDAIEYEGHFYINITRGAVSGEEEDQKEFPTGLVLTFIVILVIVFLISILRREAHMEKSEEGMNGARDQRKPDPSPPERSSPIKVRRVPTRPAFEKKGRDGMRAPSGVREWKGDHFK